MKCSQSSGHPLDLLAADAGEVEQSGNLLFAGLDGGIVHRLVPDIGQLVVVNQDADFLVQRQLVKREVEEAMGTWKPRMPILAFFSLARIRTASTQSISISFEMQ